MAKIILIYPASKNVNNKIVPAYVDNNNNYSYFTAIAKTATAINAFRAKYGNLRPTVITTADDFSAFLLSGIKYNGKAYIPGKISGIVNYYYDGTYPEQTPIQYETIITPAPVPNDYTTPSNDVITPDNNEYDIDYNDNFVDSDDKTIYIVLTGLALAVYLLLRSGGKNGKGKKRR